MQWTDVEVVIPATLSCEGRADSLRDLLVQLAQQCPGVVARVLPQFDIPADLRGHVFSIVSQGFASVSRPWVFYVEDDVELAPDFGKRALDAIEQSGADVISLFSRSSSDLGRVDRGERFYAAGRFRWSQCVAMRRDVAEQWSQLMLAWYAENASRHPGGVDLSMSDCFASIGARFVVHVPSLVQHKPIPSAFGNTNSQRSPTFGMLEPTREQRDHA